MKEIAIYGEKKGGGEGHTPVEASDTLRSKQTIKLLFVLSEGECSSTDSAVGKPDVYLNHIPFYKDGEYTGNFTGTIEYRAGTADQTVIPGFTASESSVPTNFTHMKTGVGNQVRISAEASSARVTLTASSLRHIEENGDMNGTTVTHTISVQGIYDTIGSTTGWTSYTITKTGKASNPYSWDTLVKRPASSTYGWYIRIVRATANNATVKTSSQCSWLSTIAIVDVVHTYPNSTLLAITLKDAGQFGGNIPEILFKPKGIKVPELILSGSTVTFPSLLTAYKYSTSPAYHIIHVLTAAKDNGGLAIPSSDLDLPSFYNLNAYCVAPISHTVDGVSISKPRYELHNQFYTRENVPTFLMYLLNACNANFTTNEFGQISVMYDHAGQAVTKQVTNANVIGGKFSSSSNDLESRCTVVNVTYNNENYFGRTDTATVTADGKETGVYNSASDLVKRYGVQTLDIVLPGCTNEAQAIRKARWAIFNNSYLTNFVSFSVLFQGLNYHVGELVRLYDNDNDTTVQSGKVFSAVAGATTCTIVLDRVLDAVVGSVTFYGMKEDGKTSLKATINSRTNSATQTTLVIAGTVKPLLTSVCTILTTASESSLGELYKVVKIDKSGAEYIINCVIHKESKYDYIDGTTGLITPAYDLSNNIKYSTKAVDFSTIIVTPNFSSNGITSKAKLQISWNDPNGISNYNLSWRRENDNETFIKDIRSPSYDIDTPIPGTYYITIYAVNPLTNIVSSGTTKIYGYRVATANSSLYPPKDIYVTGTSGLTFNTPDLSVSFNYDTLNDTVAVEDTLKDYVVEVWDSSGINLKGTYVIPVSNGAGLDTSLFTDFTIASSVTKVTNDDKSVKLTKTGGAADTWDSFGSSSSGASGACAVRFTLTIVSGKAALAGLSTNGSSNPSETGIYGFVAGGTVGFVRIWLGTDLLADTLFPYKATTLFEVEYIGTVLRFKIDGVIKYTKTVAANSTYYGDSCIFTTGAFIDKFAFGTYPTNTIRNGVFRFPYNTNIAIFGIPTRSFNLKFYSRDILGDLSVAATRLFSNPLPDITEFDFYVLPGLQTAYINITNTSTASYDIIGYKVWQCLTTDVATYVKSDINMKSMGSGGYITLPATGSAQYSYYVAAYDSFGSTDLNISSSKEATPTSSEAITWSIASGLLFTVNKATNKIFWTAGAILKGGETVTRSIVENSTGVVWATGILYIYYDENTSRTVLQSSTSLVSAVGINCYPLATYTGGDSTTLKGGTGDAFISGSQLIAGTVGASQIIAGSITASLIDTTDAVITGEAQIGSAVITNAAIKDFIQSSDYSATAHTGWKLDKVANMITTYGGLQILDSNGVTVLSSGTAPTWNWTNITGTSRPANNATVGATFGVVGGAEGNISGAISSTNITTYISNAAIGTAQIADLAVDTLQIHDDAVTIPLSFSAPANNSISSQTITTYGGKNIFIVNINMLNGLSFSSTTSIVYIARYWPNFSLLVDGHAVSTLNYCTQSATMTYSCNLSAGSHTVAVTGSGTGATWLSINLLCLEARK